MIETQFESLLGELRPSPALLKMTTAMFRDLWDGRIAAAMQQAKVIEFELKKIDRSIDQFLDRVVEADSATLVRAYEKKIRSLEEERVELRERQASCGRPVRDFNSSHRTALEFLQNPLNLWKTGHFSDRRAVLKMVFAERLPYARGEGFRTALTSSPFRVLSHLERGDSEMVRAVGLEPTLLAEPDFESGASTSFTTPAWRRLIAGGWRDANGRAQRFATQASRPYFAAVSCVAIASGMSPSAARRSSTVSLSISPSGPRHPPAPRASCVP